MKSHRIAGCFFVVLCLFAMPAAACEHEVFVDVILKTPEVVCEGGGATVEVTQAFCAVGGCSITSYEWFAIYGQPYIGTGSSFSCSYDFRGEYDIQVTARCAGNVSGSASVKVFVVGVESVESDRDAVYWNDPNGIVFTAVPTSEGKSLDCLQWQGRHRNDPSGPWSAWGTVGYSSVSPNQIRLSAGTPGFYQFRARNASDLNLWAESAEVMVDFDIELISPADGHKVVYSSDYPNGVLTIDCRASLTCGHTVDPNLISFDCEAIGNSVKDVGPVTFENGIYSCIITFTTLPEEITDFGPKTVSVKYNGVVKDSNQIEVYFPFEATNWPGAVPVQPPPANFPDIRWAEKNWYFYYKQTPVFAGYECAYYPFQSGSHYDPITFPFQPYVGSLKNPHEVKPYTYTYSGTNYYRVDGGHTYWGLDVFSWATKHETRHSKNMQSWWEQSDYDPDDDNDEDLIPDALEPYFLPSAGGPYDPNTKQTHGTEYIHYDPEHECAFTQDPTGDPNSLAHLDWAFPGSRWH